MRSEEEGQKTVIFGTDIYAFHFEHCSLNRKHENKGMLEQVVRVIDRSLIKAVYPVEFSM